MKLVLITYHFQFADIVEEILDRHEISHFIRVPMVRAKDRDGRHYGSKVFPGSSDMVQAQVPEDRIEDLMKDLLRFREAQDSHRHLEALVLGIEKRLGEQEEEEGKEEN